MMIAIRNVLKPKELEKVLGALEQGSFVDGRLTAGKRARKVKHNLQLKPGSAETKALEALVTKALMRHPVFQIATIPKRILAPMFSRYEPDMDYGAHVDNPIMNKGAGAVRTDLSVTLFLSERDSYQGGELAIQTGGGTQSVKLERGEALVYPSASIHRVSPVTEGLRLAAITWVQSQVRDPWQRELLYDLSRVRQWVGRHHAEADETVLLGKVHGNLMRMWADV